MKFWGYRAGETGNVVELKGGIPITVFGFTYWGPVLGAGQRLGRHRHCCPPLPLQTQDRLQCEALLCFQVVEKGGPYPLIVLPQFGGYWIEDPENVGTPTSLGSSTCEEEEEDNLSPSTFGYKLECKGEARAYRRHFLGKVRPRGSG